MTRKLILSFSGSELIETYFVHPLLSSPARSVRGKSTGAYREYGSFQWTSAVQALCLLFLRGMNSSGLEIASNGLIGGEGSLAASLDYAITKGPLWISDIFGVDSKGEQILKRGVLRTNSNRKRPGPVVINLNKQFLAAENVHIVIDGGLVREEEKIKSLIYSIQKRTQRVATYHEDSLSLVA